MSKLLLFGYGNPGRGDDALGPLLVEHIAQLQLADAACLVDMQLLIEHAADLTGFDRIIFVDADMSCQEPFEFSAVTAEKDASYTSHALTPAALLYVYQQIHSHTAPPAFLLRIRGYRFELGDYLSIQANENLAAAILKIQQWVPQQR
ncbi:MAG: hydrogenase maturation protease [Nitrosomonas sp.]|uniref:hydrogenase maturation protease n=1 Tax=Nitrosomonas sp. TaxID=42353 RepID=UPI0025DEFCA3|nr:hydrogenase maturation protease [Nitrosomonas sp.]MCG7757457.1 hydrogenase maturation protease [Nitrosomonas sp.]UJP01975.1 MAG: hydrogenase maturation protease [Nitrosomonas sp.]